MDKTEKVLRYIYSDKDYFNKLFKYIYYIWNEFYPICDLTPEEYISMIWSYEFNKKQKLGG